MASVARTAGAAGSVEIQTKNLASQLITPVSVPVVKWYTDGTRTVGETTLAVTGSGSDYLATWSAAQAPTSTAPRYLHVTIEVSAGVFDIDADDDISFVDATAVVGNAYLSVADVRALPNIGDDTTRFSDAAIGAAVAWFEETFEDATGVAWVPRTVTETLSGRGNGALLLGHLFPRAIIAASITTGGVATALTAAELADIVVWDHGQIARLSLGYWTLGNRNVSITYSHGIEPTPTDVLEAAKVAVRDRLLNPDPTRQFSVATEVGIVRNSTPGPKSPFGIQFVDEVVTRRSHRVPGVA